MPYEIAPTLDDAVVEALAIKVPDVTLVAEAAPKVGVTNTGLVAKATTVPLPVVVYDVPHAVPLEFAIPAPG